jgi:hypothetical protein
MTEQREQKRSGSRHFDSQGASFADAIERRMR